MKRILATTALTAGLALALLGSESASASRYHLGTVQAAGFMRSALLRHSQLAFNAGYAREVKCNTRVNDIRVKCRVSWIVGDSVFWGKGTIWLTFPAHRPYWNYSYRIVRFNEYCAIVLEGDDCTRTFVVR